MIPEELDSETRTSELHLSIGWHFQLCATKTSWKHTSKTEPRASHDGSCLHPLCSQGCGGRIAVNPKAQHGLWSKVQFSLEFSQTLSYRKNAELFFLCSLPNHVSYYRKWAIITLWRKVSGASSGLSVQCPHRLKCLSTSSPVGDAGFEGNGTCLGSRALLGVVGHGPQDLTARAQFLSSSLPRVQLPHISAATPSPLR